MMARAKRSTLLIVLALATLVLVLVGVGVWNIFGLSLPMPPPTSDISAVAGRASLDNSLLPLSEGAPLRIVRTAWTFEAGELVDVPPVVVGDLVYVVAGRTSASGRVVALDAQFGQVVWEVGLGNIADHPPVVTGDLLYVGTRAGTLLAMDRHTGEERWSFQGQYAISGQPLVEDGVLYFGSEAVYALDAASGRQRWRHTLEGRVVQPLAHAGGVVAAIGGDHHIYLIDAWNGKRRLSFPLWFNPRGGPVISSATVATTGDRANVQALDIHGRDIPLEKTMRFWWTRLWLYGAATRPPLPPGYAWQVRDAGGVTGQIMAVDGWRFYLGVEDASRSGRVLALDNESGEALWDVSLPSPLAGSPMGAATVLGNVLVVGTADGWLVGLDSQAGQMLWQVEISGPVLAAPAFTGNLMLVPLGDGALRAMEIDVAHQHG